MSNYYNNTINNSTNYNQSSILNQPNTQKEQLKIRIKVISNEKDEQINTYILNQTNSINNLHSQILEKLKIDFPTENINRDLLKEVISSQIKEFNLNNECKSGVLKTIKDNKNVQKTGNQVKRIKTNSVNLNNNDVYKVKQQLKILFPSKSIKSYDIDLSIMSKNESRKVFNFNKDEEDVFNICKNDNFHIVNHSFQTDSEGSGDNHQNNNEKPSHNMKNPIIENKKYTPDYNRTKNNYILPSFLDLILQNKQRVSILSRKQYKFLKNSCISYVDSFSILCLNEKYLRRNKEASGNTTFLENSIFGGKGRRGTRKGLLNTNTLSRTIKKTELKDDEKQVSSVSIFNINTTNQVSNKNVSSNFLNINSGHSNHSLQRNILKFQKEKGVVRNKLKFMTIKKEKPEEIANLLNAKSINNISNASIKNNNQELSVTNNLKSTRKVNSQFKTINDEGNNRNILNSSLSNKYLNRQSSKRLKTKSQKHSNKEIEYILIEGQPTKRESLKSIVNDSDFTKNDLSIVTNLTQKSKLKSKKSLNRTLEILNQQQPKESKVDVFNIVENDNDAHFASNSFKSQSNSQNKKGSTFNNVVSKNNLLEFNNNSMNLFDIWSKVEEKVILNSDNKNSNSKLNNNTNSKKKSRKSKKSKSKHKENENENEKEGWKEKMKKEKVVDNSYFERLSNSKRVIKNVYLYSNNDENYISKKKKTIENSKSKSKKKTISQEKSKEMSKSDYSSNTNNPFLVNRLTNQINEYINRNITEILNRFYDFIVFYLKKNQMYIEECKIDDILDYIVNNLNHNDYTKYEEKLNMCGVNIKLIIIDILKAYKHQVFNKKEFVECGKEVFLKSKVE